MNLKSPPLVYSDSWYNVGRGGIRGDNEVSILVVLKEIIEFTDKNNNGMYDANIDGKPIQMISTDF